MNVDQLVHDAKKVHATLEEVGDALITKKGCKIYIPARFREINLAEVGAKNSIVGYYALVVDDKYFAVSMTPAFINIDPTTINSVIVDDDVYLEFYFEPGSEVITDLELVKDDTNPYYIYNELIAGARMPWYFDYLTSADLFDESPYHAGLQVGASPAVMGVIISAVARDSANRTQHYRHSLKKLEDVKKVPPSWVKLNNVTYNATNTLAKLGGSWWEEGAASALLNPSTKRENLEDLILK